MLNCKHVYDAFAAHGVTFYAGVPDSLLKSFCAYVTDHTPAERNIITANEGSAVALAVGHHLATGQVGLVYLQNSGLGNTVNPLTSLADPEVYGVPLVLLIGWRGEPGVRDEPQHVKMGRVTPATLNAIGVPNAVLPNTDDDAADVIATAVARAHDERTPYALLVRKGAFEPYTLQHQTEARYTMSREAAIGVIVDVLGPDTPIVSTTGMPSRELFELREQRGEDHARDFLTVGSMGHSSQIALGVSLGRNDRELVCLDGDGAALMHLGGFATIGQVAGPNFKHIVLNNGAHDSVGGQPTVGFDIDLCAIARACGYRRARCVDSEAELREAMTELAAHDGPTLLEVRVRKGARKDLGRPTNTPDSTMRQFMEFLRK